MLNGSVRMGKDVYKRQALYIKTGKLTAQQLQKAMKALLAQMKKQHDKQKKMCIRDRI